MKNLITIAILFFALNIGAQATAKIYVKGNYFFIEKDNYIYEGLSKEVLVKKLTPTSTEFFFSNVNNWLGQGIELVNILDESGTAYTPASWETFYIENTGSFNNGGGSGVGLNWISNTGGGVYAVNDIVNYAGVLYKNLTGVNTDTSPDTDATNWEITSGGSGGGKFVDGTDPLDAVYTAGKVGIGTITPTEKLHVEGNARITGNVGINTPVPLDTFHLTGSSRITHTSTMADDHALEIDVDADGFGDVKGIDIVYKTGVISTGDNESVTLISIDESSATGGNVVGLEVLGTEGSANLYGLEAGAGVNPIIQLAGSFVSASLGLVNATDELAAFSSEVTNVGIFTNDNDTVTVGLTTKFEEIELLLNTVASGGGISPTFEYSTGVGTWQSFTPTDGTNGMKNSGVIAWLSADTPSWALSGSNYLVRITRTKNNLGTVPIERLIKVAAVTEFLWDKDGKVSISAINNAGVYEDSSGNAGTAGQVLSSTVTGTDLIDASSSEVNYMMKRLTTNYTLLGSTTGTAFPFTAIRHSNGSNIINTGNGVTLKAGGSYRLMGDLRFYNLGTQNIDYQFYDVTNSVYVGKKGGASQNNFTDVYAETILSPVADAHIELHIITVNPSTGITQANNSAFTVIELGGGSGSGGSLPDTGWQTPTLLNNWVNFDAVTWQEARYRKIGNRVTIEGLIKDGDLPASAIFNIPAGYRPIKALLFRQVAGIGDYNLDVSSSGNVTLSGITGGSSDYVSINISYLVD